jgi:hypothetical protein
MRACVDLLHWWSRLLIFDIYFTGFSPQMYASIPKSRTKIKIANYNFWNVKSLRNFITFNKLITMQKKWRKLVLCVHGSSSVSLVLHSVGYMNECQNKTMSPPAWCTLKRKIYNDPCVPISNSTVGRGCRSFGWDRINRGPVSQ